jgi:D-tyrosyl-tRNA(Tyr) deacylase
MKVVIQLVSQASLSMEGKLHASITQGMVCFVGFNHKDDLSIVDIMLDKLLKLRIFPDIHGKTNLALSETNGQLLIVPNFTLYATTVGSRRPSFSNAANPDVASELFAYLKTKMTLLYPASSFGVFGADMSVVVHNQGPFTLILDSDEQ